MSDVSPHADEALEVRRSVRAGQEALRGHRHG
jgi:hypothetical protein